MRRSLALALFILQFALFTPAEGRDWIHWRGPEQNGVSREIGLPDSFDPKLGPKGNVVWQQPFGGRSAPLVLDGKLYLIQGTGAGVHEGEQVVCLDEKTGKLQWTYRVNVFHTSVLEKLHIEGLKTNLPALLAVLQDERFVSGDYDTGLLGK